MFCHNQTHKVQYTLWHLSEVHKGLMYLKSKAILSVPVSHMKLCGSGVKLKLNENKTEIIRFGQTDLLACYDSVLGPLAFLQLLLC